MKNLLRSLSARRWLRPGLATLVLATLAISPVALVAAEKSAEAKAPAKRHPLRGVITGIVAEKSALMIKHEEIPGVMRPMTMMFKVDEATLKAAKVGQAITGQMARESDGFWLHDAKPGTAAK